MPREPADEDAATSRFPFRPAQHDPADEPVTGAPAGAAGAEAPPKGGEAAPTGGEASSAEGEAAAAGAGAGNSAAAGSPPGGTAAPSPGGPGRRRMFGFAPSGVGPLTPREHRRRRLFIAGVSAAAALVIAALCAGGISVGSAVNSMRNRAADASEARRLRENDCLELESRLNRLVPPGSTVSPAARAVAIRDENAAVRIYVGLLNSQRDEDGWRQLLDARTVYADALDGQAKTRTPAFYVAPRTTAGQTVADELEQWSPAQCAGSIHRLAAPEL